MKPRKNTDSADAALTLRNTIWAFPYLAVMGLIWGYLAGESSGAIVGLVVAAAASVTIGSATTIFTARRKTFPYDDPPPLKLRPKGCHRYTGHHFARTLKN